MFSLLLISVRTYHVVFLAAALVPRLGQRPLLPVHLRAAAHGEPHVVRVQFRSAAAGPFGRWASETAVTFLNKKRSPQF